MLLVTGGIFREIVLEEDPAPTREVRLAGSGLYAAYAAARLGAEVTLIAPVGEEDQDLAHKICEDAEIEARLLTTAGASGTFVVERRAGARPRPQYRPGGENAPKVEGVSCDVDGALVFGHPEWDPLGDPGISRLADGRTLVFDGQGWLSRTPQLPASYARNGTLVEVCNAEEILAHGQADPHVAFDRLPEPGTSVAVIKDGPWGVSMYGTGQGPVSIPAYVGDVRQTVGSGDVFAGAFAAALSQGQKLDASCELAARAAAAWIFGDEPLPGRHFCERFLGLEGAPRMVALAPEQVRARLARVEHSNDIGASLLARIVSEKLVQLGVRCGETSVSGLDRAPGVRVELAGNTLTIDPTDRRQRADIERSVHQFVLSTLSTLGGPTPEP
jgi:hypothetical protein